MGGSFMAGGEDIWVWFYGWRWGYLGSSFTAGGGDIWVAVLRLEVRIFGW